MFVFKYKLLFMKNVMHHVQLFSVLEVFDIVCKVDLKILSDTYCSLFVLASCLL